MAQEIPTTALAALLASDQLKGVPGWRTSAKFKTSPANCCAIRLDQPKVIGLCAEACCNRPVRSQV